MQNVAIAVCFCWLFCFNLSFCFCSPDHRFCTFLQTWSKMINLVHTWSSLLIEIIRKWWIIWFTHHKKLAVTFSSSAATHHFQSDTKKSWIPICNKLFYKFSLRLWNNNDSNDNHNFEIIKKLDWWTQSMFS